MKNINLCTNFKLFLRKLGFILVRHGDNVNVACLAEHGQPCTQSVGGFPGAIPGDNGRCRAFEGSGCERNREHRGPDIKGDLAGQ